MLYTNSASTTSYGPRHLASHEAFSPKGHLTHTMSNPYSAGFLDDSSAFADLQEEIALN